MFVVQYLANYRVRAKVRPDDTSQECSHQLPIRVSEASYDRLLHLATDKKHHTPWFVPQEQPLELMFYRQLFASLQHDEDEDRSKDDNFYPAAGVGRMAFQRAISRLFILLRDNREFNAKAYDLNGDGVLGWWDFCNFWQEESLKVKYSLAERIFITLEDPSSSRVSRITSIFVLLAIVLSAGSFVLSTLPDMQWQRCSRHEPEPKPIFDTIDTICVLLFTIEYILRLVTSAFMRVELLDQDEIIRIMSTDEKIVWPTKLQRMTRFVLAWPNLIDLAAILPSYVAWALNRGELPDCNVDISSKDSSAVILKLIRLMRVVRAFRLGRRFEAVIIISLSMRKSVRALWVLLLNICMGVLIFGSLMYFMEHGTYDPNHQAYHRFAGYTLDPQSNRWIEMSERSPFESIPHSFWWALVTATTVGYGDDSPTTFAGHLTAGVALIWSLCVLALPVGVIGNKFEEVWKNYDQEKQMETSMRRSAEKLVRKTLGLIDPLSFSRTLHIEVWHDSFFIGTYNNVFLGEAEITLELPAYTTDPVHKQVKAPLIENRSKSNRKVSGYVFVDYHWIPNYPNVPGSVLDGVLHLTLVSAEDLASIDWKPSNLPDAFVIVKVYPKSPNDDGDIVSHNEKSSTVINSSDPAWNKTWPIRFLWHREHVEAKRELERQMCLMHRMHAAKVSEEDQLLLSLPRLQDEITGMKNAVPALRNELKQLRNNTRAILAALGMEVSEESMERNHGELPKSESRSAKTDISSPQVSPRSSPADAKDFVMPNAVPDTTKDNAAIQRP